ncbi:hypothetical protein V8E53_013047 [Lactarius tabidus]
MVVTAPYTGIRATSLLAIANYVIRQLVFDVTNFELACKWSMTPLYEPISRLCDDAASKFGTHHLFPNELSIISAIIANAVASLPFPRSLRRLHPFDPVIRTPISTSVRVRATSAEGLSAWRNREYLSSWRSPTEFQGLPGTQLSGCSPYAPVNTLYLSGEELPSSPLLVMELGPNLTLLVCWNDLRAIADAQVLRVSSWSSRPVNLDSQKFPFSRTIYFNLQPRPQCNADVILITMRVLSYGRLLTHGRHLLGSSGFWQRIAKASSIPNDPRTSHPKLPVPACFFAPAYLVLGPNLEASQTRSRGLWLPDMCAELSLGQRRTCSVRVIQTCVTYVDQSRF